MKRITSRLLLFMTFTSLSLGSWAQVNPSQVLMTISGKDVTVGEFMAISCFRELYFATSASTASTSDE